MMRKMKGKGKVGERREGGDWRKERVEGVKTRRRSLVGGGGVNRMRVTSFLF